MSYDYKFFLKTLTQRPGVYCMQDKDGVIIYIGKAKNLKKRVSSYFNKGKYDSPKIQVIVKQIEHIEITITHTENEALILENNLIKMHKPRYNIIFRDDKSYPYIYLNSKSDYPRFYYYRGSLKGKGRYFGPYPNSSSVRNTLNLLQKIFLIRSCEESVFTNRSRPCLQYQIKRCSAPCVRYISKENYQQDIELATLFLDGKNEKVLSALTKPMQAASDKLDFELAVRFRDQLQSLRDIQEKQCINSHGGDIDIISCAIDANQGCVQLTFIRSGLNLGNRTYYPKYIEKQSESNLITAFLSQYYLSSIKKNIPLEILISHKIDNIKLIESVISKKAEKKINIKHSVIGKRRKLLEMTVDNVRAVLEQRLASKNNQSKRFESLQSLLKYEEPIKRIECFDISHTQGEATVASCVVFDHEGPVYSKYRKFNINNVKKCDDYAAMRQVISRRYKRLIKDNSMSLPDLIIIDGGKGQLGVVKKELSKLEMDDIPILGVAKGPSRKAGLEKLIFTTENHMIDCNSSSPALHLIQHVRDEAHRFAITAHRRQRKNSSESSNLEQIKGIGKERRKNLIQYFGGIQGVIKAGVDDILVIPGINIKLAKKIYEHFH